MSTQTQEHEAREHPSHLEHHFATPTQQFESAKSGMWLFLSTEILLFSGLFCAYAVYRGNHPEVFIYAHQFLDKTLGGINTLVLILSSLTAAWAVRAAQLGQRRLLIALIFATLLCSCGFMTIKGIEYEHKWKHGLLWGKRYNPTEHAAGAGHEAATAGHEADAAAVAAEAAAAAHGVAPQEQVEAAAAGLPVGGNSPVGGNGQPTAGQPVDPLNVHSAILPAARGPVGRAQTLEPVSATGAAVHGATSASHGEIPEAPPKNVQVFFSIYFIMTGLHGIHVLAGMIAFISLLPRAFRGEFGPDYYTPVDLTALYWHLVDLIWIYLFPLLYLIH